MRPARDRALLALLALTALALVLRWPVASHDVQHYIGPDEGEVVENVLEILKTGDPDHRHPGYPGLHFYIQLAPAAAHLWLSRAGGEGASVPELPRSGFYLLARRVSLLAGLASALVVFFAGRAAYGEGSSLLAATLVLASPLAFRESAVVSPDLMLMLFVAASLGLSLRLLRRWDRASVAMAGMGVGLATAVKYTGAVTAVPFVLAWLLGSSPEGSRRAVPGRWPGGLLAAASALVAFAFASPYTWFDLSGFVRGLATHAAYYRAADANAALDVAEALVVRGVGPAAFLAAVVGGGAALASERRAGLVPLGFVSAYLLVFAFFDRAFPRHALALLPATALLAGAGVDVLVGRSRAAWRALAVAVVVAGPLAGTAALAVRASRPTAVERAASWIEDNLPAGSRVLQDQFTPSLDPHRFRVHRLRVEERRFVGNYDWVVYSGYPPGLETRGLREAARFETEGALGDGVIVFQVPAREALMGITLSPDADGAVLGAGELAYFGEGFHAPRPGAFQTSRLSRGARSEIFFVLPPSEPPGTLEATLWLAPAARGLDPGEIEIRLNERSVGTIRLDASSDEPERRRLALAAIRPGLNRLELRYERLGRLDGRHPDTAIRLYEIVLSRSRASPSRRSRDRPR